MTVVQNSAVETQEDRGPYCFENSEAVIIRHVGSGTDPLQGISVLDMLLLHLDGIFHTTRFLKISLIEKQSEWTEMLVFQPKG